MKDVFKQKVLASINLKMKILRDVYTARNSKFRY